MSVKTRTFEIIAGDHRWKVIGYEDGNEKLTEIYMREEDAITAAFDWMHDVQIQTTEV